MKGKYLKRGDIVIISALLALAAVLFVLSVTESARPAARVVITADGEVCAELPLDRDNVYAVTSAEGENTVSISGGRVSVEYASCRNQHCVKHRAISRTGEVIVCLPNRVTVEIKAADTEFDSVVY